MPARPHEKEISRGQNSGFGNKSHLGQEQKQAGGDVRSRSYMGSKNVLGVEKKGSLKKGISTNDAHTTRTVSQ